MNIRVNIWAICLMLSVQACSSGVTGTVVDEETGNPIEGAVVLVEWTLTKGVGLTNTSSYKVAETLTDREGKFALPRCYNPFVNEPYFTIYKKDYVAWSGKFLFPSFKNRQGFEYKDGNKYNLEKFKDHYSNDRHLRFLNNSEGLSQSLNKKQIFLNRTEWARQKALEERTSQRLENNK